MSVAENQALYRVANKQGKVLLALLYSGVQVEELALLSKTSFKDNYARVQILGEQSRILNIDAHYSLALAELCESKNDSAPIWSNLIGKDDFTQIILNAAHDAELAFPDQLSADTLRHSYITYLVSQGARLNDLELIVGHIPPRDLAEYRKVKRQGPLLELADIDLYYPLIS
ncbi:hypothetical protein RS130_04760 [Paraglaciecola aquimarina]|uniref:Tyr recombinase domain-containing protein n=1 Tax=Paraglaciecola aquimarina TaxID=1235557 RepID=A0ABU3STJ9_9ALTE|nr:hypothetical protein [Paraglaciecola aquimarina]MDU0353333.1 hypothetical protein [Paraglaciecola aquimarina]